MLTYRLRARILRFDGGAAPHFPSEAEVCIALRPEVPFGGARGESRSVVADLPLRVRVNLSTGRTAVVSDTLAHELAHIWLGQSALSDVGPASSPSNDVEMWCNRVAAELLVPLAALRQEYHGRAALHDETNRLARHFKVSTLVVLRRIHDAGGLTREQFRQAYEEELNRLGAIEKGSGGDFYLTQAARVSKRFARALVRSTFEGQTSFTEAFRMLGLKKMSTFRDLGESVGAGV